MLGYVEALKREVGSREAEAACLGLTCGEHAFCAGERGRVGCRCMEGYEGDGLECGPASRPAERVLFQSPTPPRIADLRVSTLRGNRVALVYRDVTEGNRGYLMFGRAEPAGMRWNHPIPFSEHLQAFGPVLVELQGGEGIAVAFRDADKGGSGVLLGGRHDPELNIVKFGPLRAFARHQAQAMGMVALPEALVAVVFAEHRANGAAGASEGGAAYGSAVLARVSVDGAGAEVVGKYRFASGPVARIATTMVSPASFLVAFRQAGETAVGERAEASCALARLRHGRLTFGRRVLSLEPERGQIWARSLALLGDGVVAYTYHSGGEQLTKQALLLVHPQTQQLSLLREPSVVGEGFTPYVGAVGTAAPLPPRLAPAPAAARGPRAATYFRGAGSARPTARVCSVDAVGLPNRCKDLAMTDHGATSISGAHVGDGRLIFVFSDARDVARYQLMGVMDPM